MRKLRSAAAITLTIFSAAMSPLDTGTAAAAPPDMNGATRVPLRPERRACDFSILGNPNNGTTLPGGGVALIRVSGKTVVAEVQFINSKDLGIHYDVGLIQAPRPASSPCGPGTYGTAYAGMDIDGAGRGTVTIQDTMGSNTTGLWIKIERPSPHSQIPAETYTSSFLVHA